MKRVLWWLLLCGSMDLCGFGDSQTTGEPGAGVARCAAAAAADCTVHVGGSGKLNSGDTAWMLTSTALVLLMTIPGLALFYGGMVPQEERARHGDAELRHHLPGDRALDDDRHSLAFTRDHCLPRQHGRFFLSRAWPTGQTERVTPRTHHPRIGVHVLQMTFAIIHAGTDSRRVCRSHEVFRDAVVRGVVVASVYRAFDRALGLGASGWLASRGVLDFAGGTVVHINAGVAGLAAALVMGKRIGYGKEAMPPHNLVLTLAGASLLWVGWFGFNAGSAVAADGRAGMAMAVTQIATAAAALAWMSVEWIVKGKPSVLGIASGAVAGLVAITPASGFVAPCGSLVIGIAAGLLCFWGSTTLKRMMGYDDSLDAFGVHGVGGITGAILTGVFAVKDIGGTAGMLEGNGAQVLVQLIGVLSTLVYGFVVSVLILKGVDLAIGQAPEQREENALGLDVTCTEAIASVPGCAPNAPSGGANAGNHTSLSGKTIAARNRHGRAIVAVRNDRHSLRSDLLLSRRRWPAPDQGSVRLSSGEVLEIASVHAGRGRHPLAHEVKSVLPAGILGEPARLTLDRDRRLAYTRYHTVLHVLNTITLRLRRMDHRSAWMIAVDYSRIDFKLEGFFAALCARAGTEGQYRSRGEPRATGALHIRRRISSARGSAPDAGGQTSSRAGPRPGGGD
jgi:Amt family ammonium transporter